MYFAWLMMWHMCFVPAHVLVSSPPWAGWLVSPARLVGVHVSVFGTPSCVGGRRPARCSSAEAWSSPAWGGPAPLLRPRPWVGRSTAPRPSLGRHPRRRPRCCPPWWAGRRGIRGGGGKKTKRKKPAAPQGIPRRSPTPVLTGPCVA